MPAMDPVITTERMTLWQPHRRDHAGFVALMASEAVRQHLGNPATGKSEEFSRLLRGAGSWSLYGYGLFVCRLHGEDDVIGIAGVFHSWRGFAQGLDDVPEAGWILAERYWGQGLAREAMRASLKWFDAVHGRQRIACMIDQGNAASLKLADRLGFARYGTYEDEGRETLVLLERV